MDPAWERVIQARAHHIWESEGRPEGREGEHWARAVEELGAFRQDIDRAAAAESILALLGSVNIEKMPPEERMAVSTVQLQALEEWLAAYLEVPER